MAKAATGEPEGREERTGKLQPSADGGDIASVGRRRGLGRHDRLHLIGAIRQIVKRRKPGFHDRISIGRRHDAAPDGPG